MTSEWHDWANDISKPKILELKALDTGVGTKNAIEIGTEPEKSGRENLIDGLNTDTATTSEFSEILYVEAGSENLKTI